MNRFHKVVIWIFGRKLFAEKSRTVGDMQLRIYPAQLFDYAPTGDFYSLTITISAAPNFIHRFAQWLVFGVKYKMKSDI